jgi:PncC family amidohydrolase
LLSIMRRSGETLAVAESCTGGLIAERITSIAGSSEFFKLGVIPYSNDAKKKVLKISHQVLRKFGAVSEPTAIAMAQRVRRLAGADWGIGVTGIAGPSGATKTKPLGLTYLAVAGPDGVLCRRYFFKGTRHTIRRKAAEKVLDLLIRDVR